MATAYTVGDFMPDAVMRGWSAYITPRPCAVELQHTSATHTFRAFQASLSLIMKYFATLAALATTALAQGVFIGAPAANSSVYPGQWITVEVEQPVRPSHTHMHVARR